MGAVTFSRDSGGVRRFVDSLRWKFIWKWIVHHVLALYDEPVRLLTLAGRCPMPIHVDCPECGREYRLRDELAGKKFACKSCETVVAIPAPAAKKAVRRVAKVEEPASSEKADDFDWNAPLNDTTEMADQESVDELPALPQVVRKKKPAKKVREVADDDDDDDYEDGVTYRSSSSGWMIAGMPVPIVISLGCHAVLWLTAAYFIYYYLRFERPWSALGQIFWILWLSWLMYDLANGAMRARYLSILMSISGLTWAVVSWTVFIPLMALSPLAKEQPWILTIAYAAILFEATLKTTNIIALCMPSAAEHCSEWEGG